MGDKIKQVNKKKKILVLTSTFPRWKNDTLPPFVYELSKRLTEKFNITVLAPAYPGAKDFEIMDGVKVYRFHYFFRPLEKLAGSGGILPLLNKNPLWYFVIPFFLLGEYLAIKKLIKEIQPDIIHAHWIIPQGFIALLVKKSTGVPYVVTTHGGDIFGLQGKIMAYIKRNVLKNAKRITVVSNAIKKEILTKLDSNLKIDVIPMGVDSKLFNPNKRDERIKKKYGIKGPFLLFVGRLTEKKGVSYLIKAMPDVLKEKPDTKLMIIGSGEQEKELKFLVKNLKIEDNVNFMGAIQNKDLPKYYATADVFVGTSIIAEGFGLTFVEAGMCGCWLIGTNIGGVTDIIKENKNGYLIKKIQSKIISNSILRILKKNFFKNKNYKWFYRYDWKVCLNKYKKLFNLVVKNS